jgi:ribonuclease HII
MGTPPLKMGTPPQKIGKPPLKMGTPRMGEYERLASMLAYERAAWEEGYELIAGFDEAGRGPLAGPVVSAAIILPRDYYPEGLNDSKKLSAAVRERLFYKLTREALAWGVGLCSHGEIDEINILNAAKKSMELALGALEPKPDLLLIDALELKGTQIPQRMIIKGDALSLSIAAASILAKVTRDKMMLIYDKRYPGYGFAKHKGYGTKEHMANIGKLGLSPIHRRSFCQSD